MQYLSEIPKLRSDYDEQKVHAIESFINERIENPIFYDYLHSSVGIDMSLLENFGDKEILKNLLNYSHKTRDIFLYIDSQVYQSGISPNIKLTILRKILELIYTFSLTQKSVLMSAEAWDYYQKVLRRYILMDYSSCGVQEIPPYRIWDKRQNSMKNFAAKTLQDEIEKLSYSISQFKYNPKKIDVETKQFIEAYISNWWNNYRGVIETRYPLLANHFQYYSGVQVHVFLSESNMGLPTNFAQTNICLCTGKQKSTSGGCEVVIDQEIKSIIFIEDSFDEQDKVWVDLGFDLDLYRKDERDIEKSTVYGDLVNELLTVFYRTADSIAFRDFSDGVLKLEGFNLLSFADKEVAIKSDFISGKQQYEILRLNKEEKLEPKDVEKYTKIKHGILIIGEPIIPDATKKQLRSNPNIIVKDFNDIISHMDNYMFDKSRIQPLIDKIVYPHLSNSLPAIVTDLSRFKAEKLIEQLKECPVGKEGWRQFENICLDILKYALKGTFANLLVKSQARNDNGTDIRDFIIANNGTSLFWQDMKYMYDCNNIVVECKNYSEGIGNGELRQMSDYLEKEAIGRFGLIFSRKGIKDSAKQIEYLSINRTKKLILVLKEEDICDLVRKKSNGENPEDILEALKFNLETLI